MSLIPCPECSKSISEAADSCPKCGWRLIPEKVLEIKENQGQQPKNLRLGCIVIVAILAALAAASWLSDKSQPSHPADASVEDTPAAEKTAQETAREAFARANTTAYTVEVSVERTSADGGPMLIYTSPEPSVFSKYDNPESADAKLELFRAGMCSSFLRGSNTVPYQPPQTGEQRASMLRSYGFRTVTIEDANQNNPSVECPLD
jgi:hypothetical protein